MKVLLSVNVPKLGMIGEVVDVKDGFARNYLVPQGLAVEPTPGNLKRIEAEKAAYLEKVAKIKAEVEARAKTVEGKEITIAARANEEGHLYGSVGPAQIVQALSEAGIEIDEKNVQLGEAIRQLDRYDVTIEFEHEVTAGIVVWVVPIHEPGDAEIAVNAAGETVEPPTGEETPGPGEADDLQD